MEKGLPDKRHRCGGMGKVHQDLGGPSPLIKPHSLSTSPADLPSWERNTHDQEDV